MIVWIKHPLSFRPFAKKDSRVELHHYPQRRGKQAAINEIFGKAKCDVVTLFDADVVPVDKNVIFRLVKPILENPDIGISGGAAVAMTPRTLMERIAYFTFEIWSHLRENINKGSNFFAIHGKIMAVSSRICKIVHVPSGLLGDAAYLYLMCLKLGYKTCFANTAVVHYRETKNLSDFFKRRIKYENNLNKLIGIFGDFARKEMAIPRSLPITATLRNAVEDPFISLICIPIVVFSKLVARRVRTSPLWPIATTTKEV